jgi:hypothetical protein
MYYKLSLSTFPGSHESIPRWEFCVDETLKFFPHAINALLAENCEERQEKRAKVRTRKRTGSQLNTPDTYLFCIYECMYICTYIFMSGESRRKS